MFTAENIREASERYQQRLRDEPHITRARYDAKLGRVILSLSSGAWFAFRPEDAQGLGEASPGQLKQIDILPSKFAIEFTELDVQFDISSLLAGRFGSRAWMAARAEAAGKKSAATAAGNPGATRRRQRASIAS